MIRRTIQEHCKFILPSEAEEIELDGLEENWSTEFNIKTHEGVVRNIDHKGMLIVSRHVAKLGEQVTVQMVLPGYEGKVQFRGTVVWTNKYANELPMGFAIKFLDIGISLKLLKEGVERVMIVDEKFLNIPETVA